MMSWRKSTWRSLYDQLGIPTILAAAVAIALIVWGVTDVAAVVTFALCMLVVATLIQEFVGGVKHRLQKSQGDNAASALVTVVQRAKRRYGGYVVHFGMALWFFGFGGNAFKVEEEVNLNQGETAVIGDYELRFDGLSFDDDGQKKIVEADISVFAAGSGKEITTMTPARWFYRKPEDQVTTEVRKLSSFKEDLYLVLGGFDSREGTAALQVKVNPLVNFVWLGTAFMMLGFGIAAWPERKTVRVHVPIWRRVAPVAVSTACIGIAVWTSVAAFTG
jgi:cytochrome c-type biogenesis protein CcmF